METAILEAEDPRDSSNLCHTNTHSSQFSQNTNNKCQDAWLHMYTFVYSLHETANPTWRKFLSHRATVHTGDRLHSWKLSLWQHTEQNCISVLLVLYVVFHSCNLLTIDWGTNSDKSSEKTVLLLISEMFVYVLTPMEQLKAFKTLILRVSNNWSHYKK